MLIYKDRTKDIDGPKEKKKAFIRSYSSIGEALAEGDKLVSEEEFGKLYKYPFEYASMEKILQAIQDHDPRYAYLCPQITVNKSIFVYDLETFVPLYYDYAIQGVKINTNDVKSLYSTVKESNSKTIKYQYINLDKNSITRTSENSTADQATSPSPNTSDPASSPVATESRPENTSAIAHGEARTPNASVSKNYKYKADEKSAEYYTELRKKFEEEDKIKKEKDSVLAIENAKRKKKSNKVEDCQKSKLRSLINIDKAQKILRFKKPQQRRIIKRFLNSGSPRLYAYTLRIIRKKDSDYGWCHGHHDTALYTDRGGF